MKPEDLFFNEMLPKEVNQLLYKLRKVKRETRKITTLYSKDGVIKVRNSNTRKLYDIITEGDMRVFMQESGISNEL